MSEPWIRDHAEPMERLRFIAEEYFDREIAQSMYLEKIMDEAIIDLVLRLSAIVNAERREETLPDEVTTEKRVVVAEVFGPASWWDYAKITFAEWIAKVTKGNQIGIRANIVCIKNDSKEVIVSTVIRKTNITYLMHNEAQINRVKALAERLMTDNTPIYNTWARVGFMIQDAIDGR